MVRIFLQFCATEFALTMIWLLVWNNTFVGSLMCNDCTKPSIAKLQKDGCLARSKILVKLLETESVESSHGCYSCHLSYQLSKHVYRSLDDIEHVYNQRLQVK